MAAAIIASGITTEGAFDSNPGIDSRIADRAVNIARHIERCIAESARAPSADDSASSSVRVWARPAETLYAIDGLVCVELPPNCSINGDHGTMHKMITDLLAIAGEPADGSDLALDSIARLADIREWLARNPL